ncbi:MAG: hypothetical protein EBU52_19300, partial [Cytophagia bacterium]|nr:hypothetical protein [Cytophagia bacterium]
IDSLGQLQKRDTIMAEYTYHNNRTEKQAQAIVAQLVTAGCSRESISYTTTMKPEAVLEKRKIQVKAVLKRKE